MGARGPNAEEQIVGQKYLHQGIKGITAKFKSQLFLCIDQWIIWVKYKIQNTTQDVCERERGSHTLASTCVMCSWSQMSNFIASIFVLLSYWQLSKQLTTIAVTILMFSASYNSNICKPSFPTEMYFFSWGRFSFWKLASCKYCHITLN